MQTKTYTLLVTVRDDGSAPVFNPIILAAAVKGALEQGCEFALDSTQAAALKAHPLIRAKAGQQRLEPAISAEVDAFSGDLTHLMRAQRVQQVPLRAARLLHAELREGR